MNSKNLGKITHQELVEIGRDWLLKPYAACAEYGHSGCGVVITEITTALSEQPDVIGFSGNKSILIECKASRSDFHADKSKPFRAVPETGLGEQRWYMAPQGIIKKDEVPPSWGLLEVTQGRVVSVIQRPEKQEHNKAAEIIILTSLLRRLNIQGNGHVAIKKYEILSDKNKATFYVEEEKKNMTYIEAESIKQDFIVHMEFADAAGKERVDAMKEVAEKYTVEQMAEAYKVLMAHIKSEKETLKTLFILAVQMKKEKEQQ